MKKVIQKNEADAQLKQGRSVILVYGETELKISPRWNSIESAIRTLMGDEQPEKILVVV